MNRKKNQGVRESKFKRRGHRTTTNFDRMSKSSRVGDMLQQDAARIAKKLKILEKSRGEQV